MHTNTFYNSQQVPTQPFVTPSFQNQQVPSFSILNPQQVLNNNNNYNSDINSLQGLNACQEKDDNYNNNNNIFDNTNQENKDPMLTSSLDAELEAILNPTHEIHSPPLPTDNINNININNNNNINVGINPGNTVNAFSSNTNNTSNIIDSTIRQQATIQFQSSTPIQSIFSCFSFLFAILFTRTVVTFFYYYLFMRLFKMYFLKETLVA